MKVQYTARKADISDKEKAKVQRKLDKIHRILSGNRALEANVVLSRAGHSCDAEVTLRALNHTLVVNGTNSQPFNALTLALNKLEKQAVKNKQRIIDKSRRGARETPPAAAVAAAEQADEQAPSAASKPRIVRAAGPAPKPMTLEEATMELQTANRDQVTFRDAESNRVNVLVRRRDGALELIET